MQPDRQEGRDGTMADQALDLTRYSTSIVLEGGLKVDLYSRTMFRVRMSKLNGQEFPPEYEIPFVIGRLTNWPSVRYSLHQDEYWHYVRTDTILVRVARQGRAWSVCTADGDEIIYPSNGPVHGLFKDGYSVFDSASAFGEENLNSRYAHWFYNPDTGRYVDTYLAEDLIFDQYFIYGPSYEQLFAQFNELVGPEPILPRKAFGFFQTNTDRGQGGLMEMASQYRKRGLPCDYFILDYSWGDKPVSGAGEECWGTSLDWRDTFRSPLSPQEMVGRLKRDHFDLMLIHHSAPKFPNRADQGWTSQEFEEQEWWNAWQKLTEMGVAGTWQDTRRNDVTDSVIYNEAQRRLGDKNRVLFLGCRKNRVTRSFNEDPVDIPVNQVIGSRRTPFDWTGDCGNTWRELKFQIKAITNTHGSMKAVTYVTNDCPRRNSISRSRWLQFLAFNSVCRSHGHVPWGLTELQTQRAGAGLPPHLASEDGKGKTKRELELMQQAERGARFANRTLRDLAETPALPWDPIEERVFMKYLKLRYRLLPYLYTYAHVNYRTGLPICRPMLLAFPEDPACNRDQWPYQYMFGEWFLVAPVCGDMDTMPVYLPRGERWIDYWDQEEYAGGQTITYDTRDTERLPLFVRSGAIVPMGPEREWIAPAEADSELTIDIYPGGTTVFDLHEDDGVSLRYQGGEVAVTHITCESQTNGMRVVIGPTAGQYAGMPVERTYILRIHKQLASPVTASHEWAIDVRTSILTATITTAASKEATFAVTGQ